MCNFVAVAQTRSIEETLHGLIFQCLIVFEHLHADELAPIEWTDR